MNNFKLQSGKWRFPSNDNGQEFGIGDSGIETFRGTPIKSLAREICQNSIDAALDNNMPVHVDFKTFEISADQIPNVEQISDAFERSKAYKQNDKKTVKFFNNALNKLNKGKILCLRISDYNTTGLLGSDKDHDSPWYDLIKSSGKSGKSGISGGSFGIGKFATFACSNFRTVFYSTLDKDGLAASQGVARLITFEDENGDKTQGIGYYGLEDNMPLKEQLSLDPNFTRKENEFGTDIYVISYICDDNWKENMVSSILDGFLYAVYTERLTVEVEDIRIAKDTLPSLMQQDREFKEHADQYYRVLCADKKDAPIYKYEFKGKGTITLKILISQGFCRKVAIVRETGMKIFDKGYISNLIPFAGILYIKGEELNELLKLLENPQHTKWEDSRAEDNKEPIKIKKKIYQFIKEKFNEQIKQDDGEAIDPSVGAYLAAEEQGNQEDFQEDLSDSIKSTEMNERKILQPSDNNVDEEDNNESAYQEDPEGQDEAPDIPGTGESAGGGKSSSGGIGGSNPGVGPGTTPKPHSKKKVAVKLNKSLILCKNKDNGEYIINFTPSVSVTNGYISLFISAESKNYKAEILSATSSNGEKIEVKENQIRGINLEAGKKNILNIKLNNIKDYCSMEVKAYGNKI